jgi:hypothetical protein
MSRIHPTIKTRDKNIKTLFSEKELCLRGIGYSQKTQEALQQLLRASSFRESLLSKDKDRDLPQLGSLRTLYVSRHVFFRSWGARTDEKRSSAVIF